MATREEHPHRVPDSGDTGSPQAPGTSDYIVLNGQRLDLKRHDTDFSVMTSAAPLNPAHFEDTA